MRLTKLFRFETGAGLLAFSFFIAILGCSKDLIQPEPQAEFSAGATKGTMPFTVAFTDRSTGEIDSWLWDFGDGQTSSLKNPSHEYAKPGAYHVTLTVSGPQGSDTQTKPDYITVVDKPVADFEVSARTGDAPLAVAFTNKSVGEIISVEWDFGDGQTSVVRHPSHTYTSPGIYAVRLTVFFPDGSTTEVKSNFIVVNEIREFRPRNLEPKWPEKTEGDCSFAGHGPSGICDAELAPLPSASAVQLRITITLRETEPDWTTAKGSWNETISLSLPAGWIVKDILSQPRVHWEYIDSNFAYDISPRFELGQFRVMGDLYGGNDICGTTMNNSHVYFENMYFRVRVGPR